MLEIFLRAIGKGQPVDGDGRTGPGNIPLPDGLTEEEAAARDAINMFSERGVAVKIFTSDESEKTAEQLREVGVSLQEDPLLTAIDGPQLQKLATTELAEITLAHTVIGSLTPQKSAALQLRSEKLDCLWVWLEIE